MKYDKISFQVLQVASAPFLRCAKQPNALKHSLLGNQKSSIWSPAYYMEYKHSSMAESIYFTQITSDQKAKKLVQQQLPKTVQHQFIYFFFSQYFQFLSSL